MTTLHLLPSTAHQTSTVLKQNSLAMLDEAQLLRRAIQSLGMSWQGGGQEQFAAQANALLRKLQTQAMPCTFSPTASSAKPKPWRNFHIPIL